MAGDGGDSSAGGAPSASAAAAGGDDKQHTHGFRDYYLCLRDNPNFRFLWIAEVVDNIGSWLSYVATLTLVEDFSGGSGLALSAVVLIRFLPSLALAPVCGVVADRANRVLVLVAAALIDAVVVAFLALVRHPAQVPLLYVLLTLQFTAASFYDPARKALVPVLVPPGQLHLATTIDSFAWSLTGALGASVGGVVASRLGKQACFLLDALTYTVAAWCAWKLPRALGAPDAAASFTKRRTSSTAQVELAAAEPAGAGKHGSAAANGRGAREEWLEEGHSFEHLAAVTHAERRQQQHHQRQEQYRQNPLQPLGREPASLDQVAEAAAGYEREGSERQPLRPQSVQATAAGPTATGASRGSGGSDGGSGGVGAVVAAAVAAVAEGLRAMVQGWQYITARQNRDVAALVLMKSTAALVWGAVDIFNVKFSSMPSMKWLGDSSTTLGLIFAAVGLGCFVGPVVMNRFVPPQPSALRWGVAASYCLFFCGFLLTALATNILLLLASTFVRAMGSATLWVYSTLLLQQRVPNDLLGRMSAIEMAMFTIAEAISSVFGGAAFDVLHLTLPQLVALLTVGTGVMAAGWSLYAHIANRANKGGGGEAYQPVCQVEGSESEGEESP